MAMVLSEDMGRFLDSYNGICDGGIKASFAFCIGSLGICQVLNKGIPKKPSLRGLSKQFRDNLFKMNLLMFCNIFEDSMQCTNAKRFVAGDGEIMCFPVNDCRQALVAARLVASTISIPVKKTGKFIPIDISGQFHTAINSSFTWCSLIRRGRSSVLKWQDTAS